MKRKKHLLSKIEELEDKLIEWENIRDYTDNPNEQKRSEIQIARIKTSLDTYRDELNGYEEKGDNDPSESGSSIQNSKNTISNSSISAGGNVHIGDVINIHQVQQQESPEAGENADIAEKIQNLITQSQIREALELMLLATKNMRGSLPDHTILLTQQWNSLQSDRRASLISDADATVRANRIVYGLNELVKELKRDY